MGPGQKAPQETSAVRSLEERPRQETPAAVLTVGEPMVTESDSTAQRGREEEAVPPTPVTGDDEPAEPEPANKKPKLILRFMPWGSGPPARWPKYL